MRNVVLTRFVSLAPESTLAQTPVDDGIGPNLDSRSTALRIVNKSTQVRLVILCMFVANSLACFCFISEL